MYPQGITAISLWLSILPEQLCLYPVLCLVFCIALVWRACVYVLLCKLMPHSQLICGKSSMIFCKLPSFPVVEAQEVVTLEQVS